MSALPSTVSLDELLEQLKSKLPEPLSTAASDQFTRLWNKLQYAELKIQVLEERLRLKRIEKYGLGSEKLSNEAAYKYVLIPQI